MSGFDKLSSVSGSGFEPPAFYNFPPFFTLQPVQATHEKQLKLWRELVVSYHTFSKEYVLDNPYEFPLFKNEKIDRKLSSEFIDAVVKSLIDEGMAEWENKESTKSVERGSLLILSQSSESLALEIYAWAGKELLIGSVVTLYEIYGGEEYPDSQFNGMSVPILRRALDVLESSQKCVIIEGASADEDGIKFL